MVDGIDDDHTNPKVDERRGYTSILDDWALDPFGTATGDLLVIDQVSVLRIATVAAEAAARIQREGLDADPINWMISPLAAFGGQPPIAACIDRLACAKAILLHGLGLDLAMKPGVLESLVGQGEGNDAGACHD